MSSGSRRKRRSNLGGKPTSRIAEVLLHLLDAPEGPKYAPRAQVLVPLALALLPLPRPEPGLIRVYQSLGDHHDLAVALLNLDQVALFEMQRFPYLLGYRHPKT